MGGVEETVTAPAERWGRYVALGDSFTEGLWDPDPGHPGGLWGWADRLAARLSTLRRAAGRPPVQYANLAIRGRLLPEIIADQLPRALDLRPDLVSLVGGGNDMLRPIVDIDTLAVRLEAAVVRLRRAGIDVLLATGVDTVDSPLIRFTRGRAALFNSHVWSMARRHGAYVLDVWGMRSLRDWRMWDADRIHLTPEGHARVTQGALVALGLEPDDARWDDPLTPLPTPSRSIRLQSDLGWLRTHVYPWATRRLRGRSSGRHRSPKRPHYLPMHHGASLEQATGETRTAAEDLDAGHRAGEDGGTADILGSAVARPGTADEFVRDEEHGAAGPETRGPSL